VPRRGLFVQTAEEYAEFAATVWRRTMAATLAAGGLPPEGLLIGIVGAGSPVHSSGLGAATAIRPPLRLVSAPASWRTAEIVRRLNEAQPAVLLAYATKLAELAREQREGRLRLNLRAVTSMSEAISPAERAAAGQAFGVPVTDMFVSTEGLVGHSEPGGTVLTFASDTCIAECTDDEDRPVPDGVASAKVLVTNLHNLTQPIIRYELTDRFTPAGTSEAGALRASAGMPPAASRWRHALPCCSPIRPFACRAASGCCSCSWRSCWPRPSRPPWWPTRRTPLPTLWAAPRSALA